VSLKIAYIGTLDTEQRTRILAAASGVELLQCDSKSLSRLSDAEIVAGHVSKAALARTTRLKWVHSWAAGPDAQLFPEFIAHPAILTSSKGNGAVPLAEHAMMLMLMLNRNATSWLDAQRAHRWNRFSHGELNGLTVGIIGTGHSGSDLARKAKAFHMQVLGLARTVRTLDGFDRVFGPDGLYELLTASDFVVVTAPRTPETVDLLGEAEFRIMKPSAFFICFSRGGIANDDALFQALDKGWIAGAGLDAHTEEPLPANSRFWSAPNTIVTPHNGATTPQTSQRGQAIFVENLRRFVAGVPLLNIVDKELGY
jgi:phosphoglycerate dehydrogenase-like enzyme